MPNSKTYQLQNKENKECPELDPLLDLIFEAVHPRKNRKDANPVTAQLKSLTGGRSSAQVYQLIFFTDKPNKEELLKYILKVHSGPKAASEESNLAKKISQISEKNKYFLAPNRDIKNDDFESVVVYEHAKQNIGSDTVSLEDKIVDLLQQDSSGYDLSDLEVALGDLLKNIVNTYDELLEETRTTASSYFKLTSKHLIPSLHVDARNSILEHNGDTFTLPDSDGGNPPTDTSRIKQIVWDNLSKNHQEISLDSGWYTFRAEIESFDLAEKTCWRLKLLDRIDTFIWLSFNGTPQIETKNITKKPYSFICKQESINGSLIIRSGCKYLEDLGLDISSSLATSKLGELCSTLTQKLRLSSRHNDLHCGNILCNQSWDMVVIDLGSGIDELCELDFISQARLEISIWNTILKEKHLEARAIELVLKDLEAPEEKKQHNDEDPGVNFAYSIMRPLRMGKNIDFNMAFAYVTQVLRYQRYFIENSQSSEKFSLPTGFSIVSKYWIDKLREFSPKSSDISGMDELIDTDQEGDVPPPVGTEISPETTGEEDEVIEIEIARIENRFSIDGTPTLYSLWDKALRDDSDSQLSAAAEDFLNEMHQRTSISKNLLTEIQRKVWENDKSFHSTQNVIIAAPTSSGKSTLAEIFLAIPSVRYSKRKCAIYIAPTRALTQAKYLELKNTFGEGDNQIGKVVLSTGEDTSEDWRITNGSFSVACMVYEKANILFSQKPRLLDKLGCIVVDEMHMIMDLERGPILEMALTKALSKQRSIVQRDSLNETMRLILISTEEDPQRVLKEFIATRNQTNYSFVDPLCFVDDKREVTVDHVLILAGKEQDTKEQDTYEKFCFMEFSGSGNRNLTEIEYHAIDTSLRNFRREKGLLKIDSNHKDNKRLIRLILDLLIARPQGIRILVFLPGRQEAETRALQLKNKLAKRSPITEYEFLKDPERHQVIRDKFKDLLDAVEDTRMEKAFRECIDVGIFIHHSDVERKIRAEIEAVCSSMSPDTSSQVIFATETLSYGINLAIQDVILFGVNFFGQDRFGKFCQKQLSKSAYHNMIGRAGRKGKVSSEKPCAYIFVPSGTERPERIVKEYYTGITPLDSQLYVYDDIKVQSRETERVNKHRRSPWKALISEDKFSNHNHSAASNFSYPFARSVLDALRHLNIQDDQNRTRVRKDDLMELLEQTLYGHKISSDETEDSYAEYQTFTCAVERILDDCSNELDLVKKSQNNDAQRVAYYEITSLGEAIIDTGTEISTVSELLKTVKSVHRIWHSKFGDDGEKEFPIELYLLCIIAQREVFREVIRFVPECKIKSKSWPEDLAAKNSENVKNISKKYLSDLKTGLTDEELDIVISTIRTELLDEWDALRELVQHYESAASDGILRLFNGILAWISGEDRTVVYDLIEGNELNLNIKGKMQRLRHFTEILSFKVLFLSKMLEKNPSSRPHIAEKIEYEIESERNLQVLALRLRFGSIPEAVPFFKPSRSAITRRESQRLCKANMTPRCILTDNFNDSIAQNLQIKKHKLALLSIDLKRDAENSLQRLIDELTAVNIEGEHSRYVVQELVRGFSEKFFGESIKSFKGDNGIPLGFDGFLRDTFLSLGETPLTVAREPHQNRYEIKLSIPGNSRVNGENHSLHTLGSDWIEQVATATIPDVNESDDEPAYNYTDRRRIRLIGVQFNSLWGCYNRRNKDFEGILQGLSTVKHLVFVSLPWVPHRSKMPVGMMKCFKDRTDSNNTTNFISLGALASMLIFLVRKFSNLESYAEDFTNLLTQEAHDSCGFNCITVEDVRRVMRQREADVPRSIMQALLVHFEADDHVL